MYDPTNIFVIFIVLIFGFILGFLYRWVLNQQNKKRNLLFQGSVLKGKISEQLAPYLPGFPKDLKPSETRFLGSPVDFIVFKGMDEKNITEIVFVEVKSGHGGYHNNNEDTLKMAIDSKKISWVKYNVPPLPLS
jgi:predicted Holliday junction resolvase-like endonuclease